MKCAKCTKDAEVPYPNGDMCSGCFLDVLVNRIKKETKVKIPFEVDEKVLVFGDLAKWFLDKIREDIPFEIIESNEGYNKDVLNKDFPKYDKVVIPWTADDEAALFYEELTKSKANFNKIGQSKIVKLFLPVLDKELKQAAKILDIEFEIGAKNEEVEKIGKKYPSSKFGLVKSAEEFKKASQ